MDLGGARAGMIRHRRGLLQRAAVLEIRGDAGGPEVVIADHGLDAGGFGPPTNHGMGVSLRQGCAGTCHPRRGRTSLQRGTGIVPRLGRGEFSLSGSKHSLICSQPGPSKDVWPPTGRGTEAMRKLQQHTARDCGGEYEAGHGSTPGTDPSKVLNKNRDVVEPR